MSIVCICVTVKIKFDNTGTCTYSKYSPSAQLLCHARVWPPPLKNSGSAPVGIRLCIPRRDAKEVKFQNITNRPNSV